MNDDDTVISLITRLVQTWFSDLGKVRESEKQWFNCKTALKHILDPLKRQPQILLKRDDAAKGTTKDFSRWIFIQLLRMMGAPNCTEIHSEILPVIEVILVDYQCKVADLYQAIVSELVVCLINAATIRYKLEDNPNFDQLSLLMFAGKDCLVTSPSVNSICLSNVEKCEAIIQTSLHLLNLHFYVCKETVFAELWNACGQVIELCPPALKCCALRLVGNVCTVCLPDPLTPEFNYVLDLALHLLTKVDFHTEYPGLSISVTELLTMILTGHKTWEGTDEGKQSALPWICVSELLKAAPEVFLGPNNHYKEWMVSCIEYVYTNWDIDSYDAAFRSTPDICSTIPDNRAFLTMLVIQMSTLEEKVCPAIFSILGNNRNRKRHNIKDEMLVFAPLYSYFTKVRLTSDQTLRSPVKPPTVLINFMLKCLEGQQLKVLEKASSNDMTMLAPPPNTNLTIMSVLWMCIVSVWREESLVKSKTSGLMNLLQTVYSPHNFDPCLSILCNTLVLYQGDDVPSDVKDLAKKIMNSVKLPSLSSVNMGKLLHCYVLLGSHSDTNLPYFLDPLRASDTRGSCCVLPLIHLLTQLPAPQIGNCLKVMVTTTNTESLVQVSKHLDQIVLAIVGKPLVFKPGSNVSRDLYHSLEYDVTSSGNGNKITSTMLLHLLSIFNSDRAIPCTLHALEHLGLLAQHIDTDMLLNKVIPLALHEDGGVRRKLAKRLRDVGDFSPSSPHTKVTKLTDTQKKILMTLKQSLEKSDDFLKTSLAIAVSLGCNARRVFMGGLMMPLLTGVMEEEPAIKRYMRLGLEDIAAKQGLGSVSDLFDRYNVTVCEIITRRILQQPDLMINYIEEIAAAFFLNKHGPVIYFLSKNMQYLLPPVLAYGGQSVNHSDAAQSVLKTFGHDLKQTVKSLIVNNFMFIFVYISRLPEHQDMVISFIEKVSGMPLSELMLHSLQPIYNHLLLYLAKDRNIVLWGLNMLEANIGNSHNTISSPSNSMIAKLVEPRLLGILVSFSCLQLGRVTEETNLVLESITELMEVIGPGMLTKWKDKIISILRNGLSSDNPDIRYDALRAWDKFVRLCEVRCMGPLTGEIVAVLLAHLNTFPTQVTSTLKHLLIERWSQLKDHVGDIGWLCLPDHPELAPVKAFYSAQIKPGPMTEDTFKALLSSLIHGITRGSGEVRAHALQTLQITLHNNQRIIHDMVLGKETVDIIISQLISTLLCGVKDPDPQARLLFCCCLGEVGAIDEGLLDSVISTETSNHKVFLNGIEDDSFGPELLIILAKGYRNSSEQQNEDKYAFAIQEILSAYRVCGQEPFANTTFTESVWAILEPHKNSKYQAQSHNWPDMVSPVFRAHSGCTFEEWLRTWTCLLLKIVPKFMCVDTEDDHRNNMPPVLPVSANCHRQGTTCHLETSRTVNDVKSTKLAGLLIEPLKIITSAHTETLQFLLPNLILQILLNGDQPAVDFVLTEIQAVLYATQGSVVKCDVTKMSAQTIFSLIDYLMVWVNQKRLQIAEVSGSVHDTAAEVLKRVEKILNTVSKQTIAVSAFNCGNYNRALMYLEYKEHLTDQKDWELLQKIYVYMGELDGVAGVTASRNTPASLKEQIQAQETAGKLQDTVSKYEQGMTQSPDDMFFVQGMFRRMIHVGQLTSLVRLVQNMIWEKPALVSELNEYRVQAAWSLARWDLMEEYISKSPDETPSWAVGVGRQFLAARNGDKVTFAECIDAVRRAQLVPLSAAVMEGRCYERCYENMLNLHMLRDIEEWCKCMVLEKPGPDTLRNLTKEFESRIQMVQDTWSMREPVYNLQRSLLHLVKCEDQSVIREQLGQSWLHSASLARKEMLIPCGDSALQNASIYNTFQYQIEHARWLWDKNEQEEAMAVLKQHLSQIDQQHVSKRARADARLLYAKWCEKTAYFDSKDISDLFRKVTRVDETWEEAHFQLANYYYKWSKAVNSVIKQSMMPHVIRHYGESLKYGTNNIFQSMPRLLTTWFELEDAELGAIGSTQQLSSSQAMSKINYVQQANEHISSLIKQLPSYQWLTALSQLLSRICHPSPAVSKSLKELCSLILYHHPQQTFWQIYGMTNNSNKERCKRSSDIIKGANALYNRRPIGNQGADWFLQFYRDFKKLCTGLFDISSKDSGNNELLSINKDFRHIKKMLEDPKFSRIILPIQHNTTVTLPVGQGPHSSHDPFPHYLVTIASIQDEVRVLWSLQRPKKITVLGSNGRKYGLLCKPKDDLRKDCRFMEFNMMVNRLLKKDVTARKKQLQIRTYAVIPLSESSGIVEWVDHTKLLRVIIKGLYAEYKKGMTKQETRSVFSKLQNIKKSSVSLNRSKEFVDLFNKTILPRHPPVLSEWFRRTFPDPSSWFTARQKYIHSTAVISMVGYVVGLGDRHAENIMFDYKTGETVHVDFDCLFEKGETFDWPEMVPFRLTHNMVDAFGVTGTEGMFRLSCVTTMGVMRNERESLISVLKTFVHDPLVEWANQDRRGASLDRGRQNTRSDYSTIMIMKDRAQKIMKKIEEKLNGRMGKIAYANLPISTEGQVEKLISDSVDPVNLSQMYIGWAAYY